MKPSKLLPYKCLKLACCYVSDDKKNTGPAETFCEKSSQHKI